MIKIYLNLLVFFITFFLLSQAGYANEDFNIYNIDLDLVNLTNVIEKGTKLNLVLTDNINSKNKTYDNINLQVQGNPNIRVSAFITKSTPGKRLSRNSNLEITTDKLILDDGLEVPISASTPIFQGVHPLHASTNTAGLSRLITGFSFASSPLTLGTSLGINFLVSGLLSSYQNGISDFVWGGFSGCRLSFIESILRKQPDIHLDTGSIIPVVLKEDLKISNGIHKEKLEYTNISKEDALNKIKKLLELGDITGAIELSVKTGQDEIYSELLKKISS